MSSHAIQDAENTLVKAEPVIAAHAGAAILGYIGTLLVTHGVITHDQASALTQQVLPAVVAGLLVLLGVIVRRVVSPAVLFAQRVEEEVQKRLEGRAAIGMPTDRASSAAIASVMSGVPADQLVRHPLLPSPVVPAAAPTDAGADVLAQADAIHPMPGPTPA